MARIKLDPLTRIEGHLKIEVELDSLNKVTTAYASGTMFRGFENILKGRDPRDAIHITQRICGVCPVPHATAAVEALEKAFGLTISQNARLLRNLTQGTDYISDHLFHFYHLSLLDYVKGPAMSPFENGNMSDYRLSDNDNQILFDHYVKALRMRRIAQEMGALIAGKIPHIMSYAPGGVTQYPEKAKLNDFKTYLNELITFIENIYIPDVYKISQAYNDYLSIGKGPANLLSFGCLPIDDTGNKLIKQGQWKNAVVSSVDMRLITEQVKYSWYNDYDTQLHPSQGVTNPNIDKNGAYSWLKAPRLSGEVFELGSLARMLINGDYNGGVSVMDRHIARAIEAKKIAHVMLDWLQMIDTASSAYTHITQMPKNGKSEGFTEATRGGLGHWLEYTDGKISRYQVVTPTCWNASPRDDKGVPGVIEQALTGVQVADVNQPIELYRIVRSFDPCMGCAVHVTDGINRNIQQLNL